jgi:hypothetical protein
VTLQLAAELGVENAILDGEVIAAGETGRPQFYDLLRRARTPAYVAFDLRWLNGDDVPRRSACESAPKRDPSQNCRKELKSQEKTPDPTSTVPQKSDEGTIGYDTKLGYDT